MSVIKKENYNAITLNRLLGIGIGINDKEHNIKNTIYQNIKQLYSMRYYYTTPNNYI